MVSLRNARYCNLKLLLLFLVIYGHLIEPRIRSSGILLEQYRWIYLVHMPLFSFLSGLFLKDGAGCVKQFRRLFFLYLLLQGTAVLLGRGTVEPNTPYWILWYLMSCSIWCAVAWLWFRFSNGHGSKLILLFSILLGCVIGYAENVDREYALSRTIVFFPYFWIGLICDVNTPWQRFRPYGLAALGIATVVILCVGGDIPTTFLWQATPYGVRKNGFILRLICYFLGFLLGSFLLTFTPARRYPFTKFGADTMPTYILQTPFVLQFTKQNIHWILYPPIIIAYMYIVFKMFQWCSKMYGIVSAERRENR